MSPSNKIKRWCGIPYNWSWPGFDAVFWNLWNTKKNAVLFPAKVWGAGWTINFGYAHATSKPLWKRVFAFLFALLLILLLIYVLIVIGVMIYYRLTPNDQLVFVLK